MPTVDQLSLLILRESSGVNNTSIVECIKEEKSVIATHNLYNTQKNMDLFCTFCMFYLIKYISKSFHF